MPAGEGTAVLGPCAVAGAGAGGPRPERGSPVLAPGPEIRVRGILLLSHSVSVSFAAVGNRERGWNDPPQFSYGLQAQAGGPRRRLLTRRACPPPEGAPPG